MKTPMEEIIQREAQRLALHKFRLIKLYSELKTEFDYTTYTLILKYGSKIAKIPFQVEQMKMSVEDISELILEPTIHLQLCDWDRAFKIETWC